MAASTDDLAYENIIFIVLTIIFFVAIIIFILKSASGAGVIEEVEAKRIALIIDNMEKDMEVNISIEDLVKVADKNKFEGVLVERDKENKLIIVRAFSKGGYKAHYNSLVLDEELAHSIFVDRKNKVVTIKS